MDKLQKAAIILLAAALLAAVSFRCLSELAPAPVTAEEEPEAVAVVSPTEVVTPAQLTGNFNPYTAEGDDHAVIRLVCQTLSQVSTKQTAGGDGLTVTYSVDRGAVFSDGTPVTAQDVLYSLLLRLDPMYLAATWQEAPPVAGWEESYGSLVSVWRIILEDKQSGQSRTGLYTQQDLEDFAAAFDEAGILFTEQIIDFCTAARADDYALAGVGVDAETVRTNENYRTAFAMWCWQFARGLDENGLFHTLGSGTYNLAESGPTPADFWHAIWDMYGYNVSSTGINHERPNTGDNFVAMLAQVVQDSGGPLLRYISLTGARASVPSGITVDGDSVTVTLTAATDALDRLYVVPADFYGSYVPGNVAEMLTRTDVEGSGEYKLSSFDGSVATLTRTENGKDRFRPPLIKLGSAA